MKKITFKNGQTPYVNDTNLNQMQNNIEEAINTKQNKLANTSAQLTVRNSTRRSRYK